MRICIIGKFPPIQGGVSMRTYWTAHRLAAQGHEVHVVTNAREVRPPFRMHMRAEDWRRCDGKYGIGSVTVHWTDPVDGSQSYIPMASPFVTKLTAIAARVHSQCPFDVVFSHYLEPYGVAGHLVAQMTGLPHVVRAATLTPAGLLSLGGNRYRCGCGCRMCDRARRRSQPNRARRGIRGARGSVHP